MSEPQPLVPPADIVSHNQSNGSNLFVVAFFFVAAGCVVLAVSWLVNSNLGTIAGSVLTGIGFVAVSLFALQDDYTTD